MTLWVLGHGAAGPPCRMRKRPCRECGHWFLPDARVGKRQVTCGSGVCKAGRRRRQQERWRRSNPDYFLVRRMAARAALERVEPLRMGRPLDQLPWDVAQSEFGTQGADFIAVLAQVVIKTLQFQMRSQGIENQKESRRQPEEPPQSQFGVGACSTGHDPHAGNTPTGS